MSIHRRSFVLGTALASRAWMRAAESDQLQALRAELIEKVRALTDRGYLVQAFAAEQPLQIKGHPAVVFAVGDAHTQGGVEFDAQVFGLLTERYSLDVILQEGRAADFDSGVRAQHAIEDYETRAVDRNLPVMTPLESSAFWGPPQPEGNQYLGGAVPVTRFFPRVLGLEDGLLGIALFRDLGLGLEALQADLRSRTRAPVVCNGKYVRPEFARLQSALRELRQLSWDPLPPFAQLPLTDSIFTTLEGRSVPCAVVERGDQFLTDALRYRDALGGRMMADRNKAAAQNTLTAFREFQLPSTVAAVIGRNHLRTFANTVSYPEAMKRIGISSLVVVPGPGQPSYDPNWRF